ncbi:uncharacterized protein FOMMEDRAFT_163946 [Fomitiporia mediterranea MF3/22]|uniref:Uncharacterized protein n=1 Tax=Fomitiporia mediterranea (strain MF3/22) TaxID=694068 RepID=R7SFZ3_FOMME|nr:uncharacterized protein FOMMEDRAFT_163946 [Fomitiporia mediterranea MF3/22]EJC97325.1 hypothetical protein FOMMEDRAFT_163946 [Fomitiporia mediterranea MF3/22]
MTSSIIPCILPALQRKQQSTSTRSRQCPCTTTPKGQSSLRPPRALSFPTHHSMLDNTLDGLTLRAFTIPSVVHDTISNNGSSGHCSHLSKLSPSTPSTLPSPFVPERPRDTLLQSMTQFMVPPIGHCLWTIERTHTDTISSAVRISSFNASDLNPSAPLTLATHHCSASISSIQLPTHADNTHAHTLANQSHNLSHP